MKKFVRTIRKRESELIILCVLAFQLLFPQYSVAAFADAQVRLPALTHDVEQPAVFGLAGLFHSPEAQAVSPPVITVMRSYQRVPITAYSSTADQTDSTPCITANGFDLCEHNQENVVAANFLKFGTKVRIPELFGEQIFTVQDRMNARYTYRLDVWMQTRAAAKQHGLRFATIEVVE